MLCKTETLEKIQSSCAALLTVDKERKYFKESVSTHAHATDVRNARNTDIKKMKKKEAIQFELISHHRFV